MHRKVLASSWTMAATLVAFVVGVTIYLLNDNETRETSGAPRAIPKSLLPTHRQSVLGENARMKGEEADVEYSGTPAPQPLPSNGRGSSLKTLSENDSATAGGERRFAPIARFEVPRQATNAAVYSINPAVDGWQTETLSEAASSQLKELALLIESLTTDKHPERIGRLVSPQFTCSPLCPRELETIYADEVFTVERAAHASQSTHQVDSIKGPAAVQHALSQLKAELSLDPLAPIPTKNASTRNQPRGTSPRFPRQFEVPEPGASAPRLIKSTALPLTHAFFKVFRISNDQSYFTTRCHFEASSKAHDSAVEVNATWICRWTYPRAGTDELPRLLSVDVDQFERVRTVASGPLFADWTASAMANCDCYGQQILPGMGRWLPQLTRLHDMTKFGYQGLAIGDVNGDDLDDVYMCESGGLPNRLFLHNTDGTVREVSRESGVDWLDYSSSALLVDLDNDGDQDLIVGMRPYVTIHENDGRGRFKLRGSIRTVSDPQSMCAADYDRDGDLDLYVCGYLPEDSPTSLPTPIPYHDANNGGSNALLDNRGAFQFVDVTREVGLGLNNSRFSYAAAWEDYDNDGDLDLYVANDFGRNNLYRNHGGRFTDVASEAGVEDVASGMSVTWGDYNRDGLLDVYVSNMFSNAGNRIAFQRRFAQGHSETRLRQVQRMARGNTLFANGGNGSFRDVSEQAAVAMGRWAWGSKFADLNNDGWLDLIVANGFITAEDPDDL